MSDIPRMYDALLRDHFRENRQMAFLSGPRQVGKTTLARGLAAQYLNWDRKSDRALFLAGEDEVARVAGLDRKRAEKPVAVFDEIHHWAKWKTFLKGWFDTYGEAAHTLVTGSARLDLHKRRRGDSLMGRYFPYRMHPLSVGELLHPVPPASEAVPSAPIADAEWDALLRFGGFPEPFARRSRAFSVRWHRLRREQLVRVDIRDETGIRDLDLLDALATVLGCRSGEQLVYASLGKELQINEVTVRQWVSVLANFFHGFLVKPWFRNVENALRKTPKWYLRDWSEVADEGKRVETLVACHLLKAVEAWTDLGLGAYELFYIRTKRKEEVDFLVVRDGEPWFLAEAKKGDASRSGVLAAMRRATGASFALQLVADLPHEPVDCFEPGFVGSVPLRTFLSQLP